MNERLNPEYSLEEVKSAFDAVEKLRLTRTAQRTSDALGIRLFQIVELVQSLTRANFYKSMTTYADHRVWQDVYYIHWDEIELYLKFMRDEAGLLIVSLKER